MKLLADTHTMLWAIASPNKLSDHAREILVSTDNNVAFSTVSLWEIAIKVSLGRLELDPAWRDVIEAGRKHLRARWLLLEPQHCGLVATLPWRHRDPFDRMLVAQAISEGMALLSKDRVLNEYAVDVLW